MEGWARLDLGELERRPVRVALGPAPSLFALAADAAGAQRGAPRDWLARVRAELEPRDLATLSPLAVRPGGFTPASVMPRQGGTEAELDAELDRIAELPADDLLADIAFARGPAPNGPWATVARHPRRWLARYAEVMRKAWCGVRGPWAQAAELFEREVTRVGTAAARGAGTDLLAAIHPRARVRDGAWMLPDPELETLHIPERGLTLIPMLGGSDSAGAGLHVDGTLDWIAYPLPEAWDEPRSAVAAPLEALLGHQRARLLRALESPSGIGALAEMLLAVPSAATHHVGALEAAGLVIREREGRRVTVHRTARGSRLVGLYEG